MAVKTMGEWYNNLPKTKQQIARQLICEECLMARSTFYKIVKGDFSLNHQNRQIIVNHAMIQLIFGKDIIKPMKPIEILGEFITEPQND